MGGVVLGTDGSFIREDCEVGDFPLAFQLLTSIVRREELLRGVYDGFGIVMIVVSKIDVNLVEGGGHANNA